MKRFFCIFLAMFLLLLPSSTAYAAEEETTAVTTTAKEESEGISKPVKVVGFLVIFTVVCVGTAYAVAAPNLKKLKQIRAEQKQNAKK